MRQIFDLSNKIQSTMNIYKVFISIYIEIEIIIMYIYERKKRLILNKESLDIM